MTTPAQVPEAPPAPVPQPRPAYMWLMRVGCLAFAAAMAGFAWDAPDYFILNVVVALLFVSFAVSRPTAGRLMAALMISIGLFAGMFFALIFPLLSGEKYARLEMALVVLSNVALAAAAIGALRAYRSVPSGVWAAQRVPAVPFDASRVHRPSALIARVAAILAIAVAFYSAIITHPGFVFFAVLFAIPHLVFAAAPVRASWVAWGKAMAWCMGIVFLLVAMPALSPLFGHDYITRSERHFMAFVAAVLATQIVQLVFLYRAYRLSVPMAGAVSKTAIYFFVILMLFAVALPGFYSDRKTSNESSGAGSLRTINTTAANYSEEFKTGFPPSLKAMGPGDGGKDGANLIDSVLASGQKTGYRFTYTPKLKDGVVVGYTAVARPVEYEETGIRSFFTDESGVIRSTRENRDANANDPPL